MSWDTFYLPKTNIGELIESGKDHQGHPLHINRFILLPENNIYTSGYGFYLSDKIINTNEGSITLPDGYKIELQMSPSAREPGKRYKRYKLTGAELKEQVLRPFAETEAQHEQTKKEARDKRNQKIFGNIVYGRYAGNHYGDLGDLFEDYFFQTSNRYYNHRHEKVQNVQVSFVVMENMSKYFFDTYAETIQETLHGYVRMTECTHLLESISYPDAETKAALEFLQTQKAALLQRVQATLKTLSQKE